MKKFKLFIALVAISLGVSSCTSTSDTALTGVLTTAYFVRNQTLVDSVYSYSYNPFLGLSSNKNLVGGSCTVNDKDFKIKQLTSYYFFSDYVLNTPLEAIEDLDVQFFIEDEDQNTLTVSNTITGITDDMGPVNLKSLKYIDGIIYLTYDESENASQYVLTVRLHNESYRSSFGLSNDGAYTLSKINFEIGTQLDVCLSIINSSRSVVADSEYYTITVGTDFSTQELG